MAARHRERHSPASISGKYRKRVRWFSYSGHPWGNWTETGNPVSYLYPFKEIMDDTVSEQIPYPDHDLYHYKFTGKPGRLTGTVSKFSSWYGKESEQHEHTNTHVGHRGSNFSGTSHLLTSMSFNPDHYLNEALVAGNPGKSEIDLGEFLGELGELPSLFIPGPLRQIPIKFLFGVLPLVGDLVTLTRLSDSIDKRREEINRMVGSTRKDRYGLGKARRQEKKSFVEHYCSFETIKTTELKAWCVKTHGIEYNKLRPLKRYDTKEVRRLLTSDLPFITAWNLMPWSWLIDYFFDVNGMLNAHGNKVPGYHTSQICICVNERTKFGTKHTGFSNGWDGNVKLLRGSFDLETRRRKIYINPSPRMPSFWPILSNRQIGNLAALGLAFSSYNRDGLPSVARRG